MASTLGLESKVCFLTGSSRGIGWAAARKLAEEGATVSFGEVLLLADGDNIKVGSPLIKGGKVEAVVEKHGKGDKKVIVKFRRRKHYLRQGTHRQQYTQVKITGISA